MLYTPGTWVSDVWLFEALLIKGFSASFLLIDILPTSILICLFSFPPFFTDVPVVVLVGLGFVLLCMTNSLPTSLFILQFLWVIFKDMKLKLSVLVLFAISSLHRLVLLFLVGSVCSVIAIHTCFNCFYLFHKLLCCYHYMHEISSCVFST